MIINETYISATAPASRSAANRTVGFLTDLADYYDVSGFHAYISATLRDITAAVLECPLTVPAGIPQVTVADKDYDSYSDIAGWLNGNPPRMYAYDPSNDDHSHRMLCVAVPVIMPDTLTGQQAESHLTPLSSAIIAACSMRDGAEKYGDGTVMVFCGHPDGRKSVFRSASHHGASIFHDAAAIRKTVGAVIAGWSGTPPEEYLSEYLGIDAADAMFRHALASGQSVSAVPLTSRDGFPDSAPCHAVGPQTHTFAEFGIAKWTIVDDNYQTGTAVAASPVRFCYARRPVTGKARIYMTYTVNISDCSELDGFLISICIKSSYVELPDDATSAADFLPKTADGNDDSPATRLGNLCGVSPHSQQMENMMAAVFREYKKAYSNSKK